MVHQIGRQIVEIDVHGGGDVGREVQRQVSDLCRGAVSAYLEAAFAPFDAVETYVVIDRLDVDLGDVRLERLESTLTTALSSAVARSLRERGITPGQHAPVQARVHGALSPAEAVLRSVLHYLRHGRLPWWWGRAEPGTLEERLVAALLADADGPTPGGGSSRSDSASSNFIDDLVSLLRSDGAARARLRHQFSLPCILTLLESVDRELHGRTLRALQAVHGLAVSSALRDRLIAGVVEAVIDVVAGDAARWGSGTIDDLLRMSTERQTPRLIDEERERVTRGLGIECPAGIEAPALPVVGPAGDETVVHDGLLVDNAGVVLLHAFLPQFFAALGIVKDEALAHPSRAALLLHHLATGASTAEEHELVFAKVLCGLPIESVLPGEPPVTAEERAEATALLDSVVRHWDALRNTSADGLRGNFLARPGRLEFRDDDWVLRVERRSYDFLLDSLPWGIAHVKLPWMPRLMHVEWAA